jgi:hypothetical protein
MSDHAPCDLICRIKDLVSCSKSIDCDSCIYGCWEIYIAWKTKLTSPPEKTDFTKKNRNLSEIKLLGILDCYNSVRMVYAF